MSAYQSYEHFKVKVKAALSVDCLPTSFNNNSTKDRLSYLFRQSGYIIRFTDAGYTVMYGKAKSSGYSVAACIREVISNYTE